MSNALASQIAHYKAVKARLGMGVAPPVVRPVQTPFPVVLEPIKRPTEHDIALRKQSERLKGALATPKNNHNLRVIFMATAQHFQFTLEEIVGPRRLGNISHARQVGCYIARKTTGKPFPAIAGAINKDHSSIIHACQKIERMIAEGNQQLIEDIQKISETLEIAHD